MTTEGQLTRAYELYVEIRPSKAGVSKVYTLRREMEMKKESSTFILKKIIGWINDGLQTDNWV